MQEQGFTVEVQVDVLASSPEAAWRHVASQIEGSFGMRVTAVFDEMGERCDEPGEAVGS